MEESAADRMARACVEAARFIGDVARLPQHDVSDDPEATSAADQHE